MSAPHMPSHARYVWLLAYVRQHATPFGIAVPCRIAAAVTEPHFPALMKRLPDGGFASGQQPAWPPIVIAALLVAIYVLRGFITLVSSYFVARVSNRVVLDLRLSGPSGEALWAPWGTPRTGRHEVVASTGYSCRPCGLDGCGGGKVSDCLVTLEVDSVWRAVRERLGAPPQ